MPPSTLKTQLAQTSHALHDSSDGTWVLLQNFNLVLNSLLQDLQVACRGILKTLYLSNTHIEKSRKATGLKTWGPFREKGHESVLHIEVSHLKKLTKIPTNCCSVKSNRKFMNEVSSKSICHLHLDYTTVGYTLYNVGLSVDMTCILWCARNCSLLCSTQTIFVHPNCGPVSAKYFWLRYL